MTLGRCTVCGELVGMTVPCRCVVQALDALDAAEAAAGFGKPDLDLITSWLGETSPFIADSQPVAKPNFSGGMIALKPGSQEPRPAAEGIIDSNRFAEIVRELETKKPA